MPAKSRLKSNQKKSGPSNRRPRAPTTTTASDNSKQPPPPHHQPDISLLAASNKLESLTKALESILLILPLHQHHPIISSADIREVQKYAIKTAETPEATPEAEVVNRLLAQLQVSLDEASTPVELRRRVGRARELLLLWYEHEGIREGEEEERGRGGVRGRSERGERTGEMASSGGRREQQQQRQQCLTQCPPQGRPRPAQWPQRPFQLAGGQAASPALSLAQIAGGQAAAPTLSVAQIARGQTAPPLDRPAQLAGGQPASHSPRPAQPAGSQPPSLPLRPVQQQPRPAQPAGGQPASRPLRSAQPAGGQPPSQQRHPSSTDSSS